MAARHGLKFAFSEATKDIHGPTLNGRLEKPKNSHSGHENVSPHVSLRFYKPVKDISISSLRVEFR
jgi:hypothetical protein